MQRFGATLAASVALAGGLLACERGADAPGAQPAAIAPDVAARVGDREITVSELDAWIKEDLFRAESDDRNPSRLHELRARRLQAMIEERVIAAEANHRGVGIDEIIALEADAMGPVSEAEIADFFAENRTQLGASTLEELSSRIQAFLEGRRSIDARHRIQARADVTVLLTPPRFEVEPRGPSRGPADALVTIVEFSDFQCPFCRRALPVLEEIIARYPEQVRLVYRQLPLDRIHDRARPAAEAALCADAQDGFWAYHDLLFANEDALQRADLLRYAGEIGLEPASFERCLDERSFADAVEEDLAAARDVGITGTPAFVINGVILSGARPAEELVEAIDAELARLADGARS